MVMNFTGEGSGLAAERERKEGENGRRIALYGCGRSFWVCQPQLEVVHRSSYVLRTQEQ